MADISKINPNDGTVYNIKDTTARNGLTDRPTSFVGTRSEWNALPVATQVKYSLVNLIGEGVYKNNGTGLDDIADVGGGLTLGETSSTAYRGDRGKTAYDHSQTTGNPHGTTASDVGLGNVPNVSTNNQTPTFTEASTRNNIASGEKLSVIFGKIQKFFNDLKTVAFSGSFSDLSNKPENANTFQGTIAEWNQLTTAEKKAYDHASIPDSLDGNVTFPASKTMLNDGRSVEDLTKHNYISYIGITNYTSASDPYIVPSDGYVRITLCSLKIGDSSANVTLAQSSANATSTFVRKGTKIFISDTTTGSVAIFIPLS